MGKYSSSRSRSNSKNKSKKDSTSYTNNSRKQNDSYRKKSQSRSKSRDRNDRRDRQNQKSNRDKRHNSSHSRSSSRGSNKEKPLRNYSRRDRSDSRDNDKRKGYGGYNQGGKQRLSREELLVKRIEQRQNLRFRNSIWEYSTDEEDYQKEIQQFYQRIENDKLKIEEENKMKEETKRLRKLRRIQKHQNNGDYLDENDQDSDDDVSVSSKSSNFASDLSDSSISSDSDSDSDDSISSNSSDDDKKKSSMKKASKKSSKSNKKDKKSKKDKKQKDKPQKKSKDQKINKVKSDEDESEFESDNSFAKLCREKVNGPDKKKKQQNKLKVANKQQPEKIKKAEEIQPNNVEVEKEQSASDSDDMDEEINLDDQNKPIMSYLPIGPQPLVLNEGKKDNYSGLLPGEGEAIAQYYDEGKRIPRRGEVGLSSDQIQKYEDLGYVMSGSRHKRMNAVRKMKEAKVISQQEKKAMAIYNYQQKNKQEKKLDIYFKQMLEEKIKTTTSNQDQTN